MDGNLKVISNDSRRKTVDFKNIEPISNIKIVRDSESEDSSISDSDLSDISEYTKKKPKKSHKKEVPSFHKSKPEAPQFHKNKDYSMFSNPKKVSQFQEEDGESEYSSIDSSDDSDDESEEPFDDKKEKVSFEEKQKTKQDLLIKIQAMEKKGFEFSKKFNMTSNYEEMMFEYTKVKSFIESQAAIKFSRRCLMACVTGLEFLNKKFDPFSVKLEGWSENVMESVDDYDNIFERLHEKYSGKAEIAPELELLLTLGGSAFMFHLTNSLLKSPAMGSVVAQNNPNFLQSMMGAMSSGMKEMGKPPNFKTQQQGPPGPMETRGIRKEMRGPSLDQSLFSGTHLMNKNNSQFGPNSSVNQYPPVPPPGDFTNYYEENPVEDDDRFSIASSDSSLSSSSSIPVKKINISKNKKNQGLELNIS